MGKRLIKAPNGETAFRCCGKTFMRHQDLLTHRTKAKSHKESIPEQTKLVFESGAATSGRARRFDLIPRVVLETLAERFEEGAAKYGDFNYRKGYTDRAFIIDRINHFIEHFNAFLTPRTPEELKDDNIGAMLWFLSFMCELRVANPGLLADIKKERQLL